MGSGYVGGRSRVRAPPGIGGSKVPPDPFGSRRQYQQTDPCPHLVGFSCWGIALLQPTQVESGLAERHRPCCRRGHRNGSSGARPADDHYFWCRRSQAEPRWRSRAAASSSRGTGPRGHHLLRQTGTITDGRPTLDRFVALGAAQPLEDAFVNLTGMEPAEAGGTSSSVDDETLWEPRQVVPFSSARRWSGAVFRNHGTWVMGAPEVLLPLGEGPLREQAATFASQGKRVLLLATTLERIGPEAPPARLNPAGFVLLTEHVRPEAARTLGYFQEQGVAVKV